MKKAGYSEFDDFIKDVAQIFYNAKLYNSRGSEVFEDACTLEVVVYVLAFTDSRVYWEKNFNNFNPEDLLRTPISPI